MTFSEIKEKIWDSDYEYFTIKGRIGKQEFIDKYVIPMVAFILFSVVFVLLSLMVLFLCIAINPTLGGIMGFLVASSWIFLFVVVGIFLSVMQACGQVRRFHDFNVTGWLILLAYIFNFMLITLIVGLIIDGNTTANQYGEPPLGSLPPDQEAS